MLVLITYDVNTETAAGKKRLRKVAKQCENYGRRVQNSVFECIVDNAQCVMLKALLNDIIDENVDSPARSKAALSMHLLESFLLSLLFLQE